MSLYALHLELPGLPPMNTSDGLHWRKRKQIKDRWIHAVMTHCRGHEPANPLPLAQVEIIRCSSIEADFENLTQGGKFLLDGLVRARILEDDSPKIIGHPTYRWKKAPPRQGRVEVHVWEIEKRIDQMLGPQNVNTRPNLLGLDAPGTPSEVECLKFELQALEDENDALRKALASRKRMLADLQERYNQLKSGSQA